jgi:hypothetical protein
MNKSSNNSVSNKIDGVQESNAIYEIENNSISNDSEELNPVLEKLLLQSIQDSKDGKGISHEEMMRRLKLRYPFLK